VIPQSAGRQSMMNTLLVVPWDDERGGVISVVENLARHLRAEGHGVLFFHIAPPLFLKSTITKLGFPGVQLRLTIPSGGGLRGVVRALVFPFVFVSSFVQLIWLLRSRRIHVVNLHYPHDNFVYFAICRRLLSFRLVTSIHGLDAFSKERPLDRYSRAFRFLIQSSDLVILPSNAYRKKLLEAFPSIQDRTIYIHNCINPAQFKPAEVGRDADGKGRYILCVAVLRDDKAIDVLLHAAKPLLAGDPSLTLVIAGDGPLRVELEGLASFLGIQNQTVFLGTQGASEVATLLHGCEALVLPSRMEPFGIVLIEAMACRKPVVASAVGGIPEIVEHEISGILVEPENPRALAAALQRVLTDDDLRTTIAANGYARAMERFCSSHNGTAYLKAFASVLPAESPSVPA
jgi:glycosyltransferase involved in cell wall biosynthesis